MVSFCLCTYCTSNPYAECEYTCHGERSQAASMQYGNEPFLTWTSVLLSRGPDICWVEFKYLHRHAGWGVLFVSAHCGLSYGALIDLSSSILPQFLVKCLMIFIVKHIIQLEKHFSDVSVLCHVICYICVYNICLHCAYAHVYIFYLCSAFHIYNHNILISAF